MSLSQLDIVQFRNLGQVSLRPDPGINLIIGDNAAGKTSLLESIFYLSYGRSFRSSQTRDLIQYGQPFFRLVSRLESGSVLGIEKSLKEQTIRLNQQSLQRMSQLAELLPVIALHPDSHQLISAGPEYRRQFLDWGVFHVEHSFIRIWKDYRKALAQRNAALRHQEPDRICQLWDQPLVQNALLIDQFRIAYLDHLNQVLKEYAAVLFPDHVISLDYRRGWSDAEDYSAHLQQTLGRDKEKGYTQGGPHRADIRIKLDDKPAQTAASRGQQKKLVALFKLAQLALFNQASSKTCILLYDDLPAELDADNRALLMQLLSQMKVQLFITAIEADQLDLSAFPQPAMFHVEQGQITALSR